MTQNTKENINIDSALDLYFHEAPDNPASRKVVAILKQNEIDEGYRNYKDGEFLLQENALILSYPLAPSSKDSPYHKSLCEMQLSPGEIVVQSPFNLDSYEKLENSIYAFGLQKFLHIVTLANILGAKDVTIKSKSDSLNDRSFTANGKINLKAVDGRGNWVEHQINRLKSSIEINSTSHPTRANLDKAEVYLNQHRLDGDPFCRALLTHRQGTGKKFSLKVELLSETTKSLAAALELRSKLPMYRGEGSAEIRSNELDKIFFNVDIDIVFED